jgi:hypothetical protein
MRIRGLIWFDDFVEKIISKHDVYPEEVEQVFLNRPRFRFVEKGIRKGEDVYAAMGRTDSGRYLIVFFILKRDQRALIISAREMNLQERRHYEKR